MPSFVEALQAADGWRDPRATGSLILALFVLPMSMHADRVAVAAINR
jgi:hypothetical protein